MPKDHHGKKSKRSKHSSSTSSRSKDRHTDLLSKPEKLVSKLLKWTRKGRAKKLDALLATVGEGAKALAGVKDLHGMTLLHQACHSGHQDTVTVLLRHGADTEARDIHGNTPAHTAAAAGQLVVLHLLLRSPHPPDVALRNDQGISIEQLVENKIAREVHPALGPGQGLDHQGVSDSASEDDEDAWSRRLAEEASDGEGGRDGRAAGASTAWHGPAGASGLGGDEDDDAWADRLWSEMQGRRRQAQRAAQRSFASSFAEAHAAQQAKKDAHHQETMARLAAAQKLLGEEQSRDHQWRQQAAQGRLLQGARASLAPLDPTIARRVYDERWAALDLQGAGGVAGVNLGPPAEHLGLADVPWPLPEGHAYTADKLRDVLLSDAESPADIRRRLRAELMRWHPDKFVARFGRLLRPSDQERVLSRVKEVSQCLTSLMVTP